MPCSPGGLFVLTPPSRSYRPGASFGHFLLSDLHLGAAGCDEDLIRRDLEQAVHRKDRILVLGDVMDLVLTRDTKRHNPASLAPWLYGREDMVNAQIERAYELLLPSARTGLLDMVASGNHETAVAKHGNVDPISLLVDKLQRSVRSKEHTIGYGGYAGFLRYSFYPKDAAKGLKPSDLTLFYWHGAGGGTSVSGSAAEFEKKSFVEGADVMWFAHKHVRLAYESEHMTLTPGGQLQSRTRWNVRTGGYLRTYGVQTEASRKVSGRLSNYGADALLRPFAPGGVRVVVDFPQSPDSYQIQVEYSSRRPNPS